MLTFALNSDKHFIRRGSRTTGTCTGDIEVYNYGYEGNQNVFDILHISRWNRVSVIRFGNYIQDWSSLEVHGVKFSTLEIEFASLVSDLTLAVEDGERAFELAVNRNGVCFVNVSENDWVRGSDRLFSWADHGVKIPKEPLGSAIWNVLGTVNDAVSGLLDDVGEEFSSLRTRSRKLMEESSKLKEESYKLKEETVSFLKRLVEDKEREVGYFKSDLKEKEEELVSIKVALNALMDKGSFGN